MEKRIKRNPKKLSVSLPRANYEKDFFKWTQVQAELLKNGMIDKLDLKNLAEEIQSLGISDLKELRSRLRIIMLHLLKWEFQSEKRSKSWLISINNSRDEIKDLLEFSPSLKTKIDEQIPKAYESARRGASEETEIDIKKFPKECPWNFKQLMTVKHEKI